MLKNPVWSAIFLGLVWTNGALAAAPTFLDINPLEQRFFSKLYDKDPIDKRLQRLELMLFGTTQDGSLVERLARLQNAAADKSRKESKSPGASLSGGNQLTAISGLELKILKKNFAAETPQQRLGRLESKLFGQPSPKMSVNDRIDRLGRTIGIGDPMVSQFQVPALPEENGRSFGFSYSSPFGSGRDAEQMSRQMDQMFRQLNQDLRGIHRLPEGNNEFTPFMTPRLPNGRGLPNSNISPFIGPDGQPMLQPFKNGNKDSDTALPPYMDPNSI